ncbi:MAG: M20/M25/M40 family metallo-hydrolase [Sulfolobales archaeon]
MRGIKDILKDLIKLKCINDPETGLKPSKECVEGFREILHENNFDYEEIVSNGFHSFLLVRRRGNPVIMLMAHYDVVPPGPSWSRDPFEPVEESGRLYGRGSIDDLSNVAAMIRIGGRIDDLIDGSSGSVIICLTGDEEIGGSNGALVVRDKLIREGLKPDYLINGDGGGLAVINKRRSSFRIIIRVRSLRTKIRGRKFLARYELRSMYRHSAYFLPGADVHPLIALARDIDSRGFYISSLRGSFVKSNILPEYVEIEAVSEEGSEEIEVDINLTKLLLSLIPLTRGLVEPDFPSLYGVTVTPNIYRFDGEYHVIEIDLRAPLKDAGREKISRYLSEILREYLPEASYEIYGGGGYLYTPMSSRIIEKSIKILRRLGIKPSIVERAGASDSRYFSPLGVEAIDFGPVGGNAHGPDEYVEVWSLEPLERFYEELLKELLSS